MQECDGRPDEFQCQFTCEMTLGMDNEHFSDLINVSM